MRETSPERMASGGRAESADASPTRALVLATISFTLSFAAWGLIGGLAALFTDIYGPDGLADGAAGRGARVAGFIGRLPMGMLTDRFGGRLVFTALLAFSSIASFVVPLTSNFPSLLVAAFLIGMAGSSFSVGAAFVSRWTPTAQQGTALGTYVVGI